MAEKIIDRIFLYLEKKGIPHTRFEKDMGFSNGYLMTQKKRQADVGESVITSVIDNCLDINSGWLITGKGEMLQADQDKKAIAPKIAGIIAPLAIKEPQDNYGNQTPAKLRVLNITVDQNKDEQIVFVPVTAHAGYLRSITDPEWVESLPTLSITGMLRAGTYRAFEVIGDSMEGTFEVGDRVIARYVDTKDALYDNRNYVIVTNDGGIVIKRIKQEKGYINCFSDNDAYGPYKIKNDQILELWFVEGLLRFSIKSKQPNYLLMIKDLESELRLLRNRLNEGKG